MQNLYRDRYGETLLKETAKVLYWKDSQRIQNRLLENGDGISHLVNNFNNVKFLLPIRNPIHCTKSVLRSGHWKHLVSEREANFITVLNTILTNIKSLCEHERLSNDRLLRIWEPELTTIALPKLCEFSQIKRDQQWEQQIKKTVHIRPRRSTKEEEVIFRDLVEEKFENLPRIYTKLMMFLE